MAVAITRQDVSVDDLRREAERTRDAKAAQRMLAIAWLAAGVEPDRIYEDTCSGTIANRPGLARVLDAVRAGNALVVWKLDRIGRSLAQVVDLVGTLQAKGVGLRVLTNGIDTTSATGPARIRHFRHAVALVHGGKCGQPSP